MTAHLRITTVPPGEALWVRERWVGLSLPLAPSNAKPRRLLTSGVLSGPDRFLSRIAALLAGRLKRESGYAVEARIAVEVLARHSPEAAAWWCANAPHRLRPGRYFVFDAASGHVREGDT